MSFHVAIDNLAEKIELMLRSGKSNINTNQALLEKLGVTKDWYSRIKNGTRQLTEENFAKLCEALDTDQRFWFLDVASFGEQLGFSRNQIHKITNFYIPGIDFRSRIKDRAFVEDIFRHIKGYWESFYFSVSNLSEQAVARDFLHISRVNDDMFIECEIIDSGVAYVGWCFPMKGHLYFILEKDKIFNEIIVYCTNLPERDPPRLYGIILCLAGGVAETHTIPCGARCAFRYIGDEGAVRAKYKLPKTKDPREFLVDKNAAEYYLIPGDPALDEDTQQIISDITNVVGSDSIPLALRMKK